MEDRIAGCWVRERVDVRGGAEARFSADHAKQDLR